MQVSGDAVLQALQTALEAAADTKAAAPVLQGFKTAIRWAFAARRACSVSDCCACSHTGAHDTQKQLVNVQIEFDLVYISEVLSVVSMFPVGVVCQPGH